MGLVAGQMVANARISVSVVDGMVEEPSGGLRVPRPPNL